MNSHRAALLAVLVLGVSLLAVIAFTTPWRPLGQLAGAPTPPEPVDFTAAELARSAAYHRHIALPGYLSLGLGLLLTLALGLTPLGARLVETVARPLGGGWLARLLLGALALFLVSRLVSLGFGSWAETVRRRYGLSVHSWGGWWSDQAKSFAISAGLGLLAVAVLYALARWLPNWWWVPASLGAALLVVLASFLYPLVVEPAFNRFTPMAAGPLRDSLVAMADRDDVPVREVLVADASRRTTALNAYVSGFGATRRVVVYDTLLKAGDDQVRLVAAHELGHAKRNDVLHGTLVGALGAAFSVVLLALLLTGGPLPRWAGVGGVADPASLALLLALVALFGQLGGPVQQLVSRQIEARADVHALELTGDPATFVRMQRSLAVTNIATLRPHPVEYALFASHPSTVRRIALARDWARSRGIPVPPPLVPPSP